jgi:hypothetical protein
MEQDEQGSNFVVTDFHISGLPEYLLGSWNNARKILKLGVV